MSEPVTHAEIEDVLSSIRRLVSEDGRDASVVETPEPASKAAPRLVLTPSLRVADVAEVDAAPAQPDHQPDEASVELAIDAGLKDAEQEHVEAVADAPVSEESYELEVTSSEQVVETAPEQSLLGDDTVDQPSIPDADEPQEQSETANGAPWRDPGATLFAAAGVPHTVPHCETESSDKARPITATFAEKIAALEAVIGQADEQWEPDGETDEENSGTPVETLAWEDLEEEIVGPDLEAVDDLGDVASEVKAEATVAPEIEPPNADALDAQRLAEQSVQDQVLDSLVADEAVLDEESLRELVADIVREELQGALGERITRNVRKLVRREIHRALAVQDLG